MESFLIIATSYEFDSWKIECKVSYFTADLLRYVSRSWSRAEYRNSQAHSLAYSLARSLARPVVDTTLRFVSVSMRSLPLADSLHSTCCWLTSRCLGSEYRKMAEARNSTKRNMEEREAKTNKNTRCCFLSLLGGFEHDARRFSTRRIIDWLGEPRDGRTITSRCSWNFCK